MKFSVFYFLAALLFSTPVRADSFDDVRTALEHADVSTAEKILRPMAEKGNAHAQDSLGHLYEGGAFSITRDYSIAMDWYQKSSDRGYSEAQFHIGELYANGNGVSRDYAEAMKWFRKATEQDNPDAEISVGIMYQSGWSVVKDDVAAAGWYRKAADQGNGKAQLLLSSMYENGLGVKQSLTDAYMWLFLDSKGNVDRPILKNLASKMTSQEIADAKRQAADWKPIPSADSK